MWHKILEFFKKIPQTYYKWRSRNERLEEFLLASQKNCSQITHIDTTVTNLQTDMTGLKKQVKSLEQNVDQVNGRLETIGRGTKMELFDTLHNFRIAFVLNKQWASVTEKKEVEEIWKIYHFELGGNGQGERYYNEIMNLPESEEELLKLQQK